MIAALKEPAAVLGLGHAAQRVAEVRRAGRLLEVGLSRSPLVHEMIAAAQEITRGAPPARGDRGLGHESATSERRDLVGIDAVVLGFAAMNRPHIEGMSQHEGNSLVLAELSEPGPR